MGYCRDCKHWDNRELDHYKQKRWCRLIVDPFHEPERKPHPLALVVDGEEYSAGLLTSGEFGCILFEPKEVS